MGTLSTIALLKISGISPILATYVAIINVRQLFPLDYLHYYNGDFVHMLCLDILATPNLDQFRDKGKLVVLLCALIMCLQYSCTS